MLSITNSTSGGFYNKVTYGYATGSATRVNTYTSIAGTTTGGIVQYRYVYDDNGNIESIYRNNSIDAMYEYDGLGQLVREDNASLGRTYVYTYDDAGNILTKKVYSYTTATNLAGMSPIETKTYGYGNESWGDLLTSYGGTAITYDVIGNPLSYYNGSSYTFTWEGRRLKTATKGNQNFTFTYNDEGIRTSKTVNGVEHVYVLNGSQIISESWGNNLIIYAYDAAGAPIGMRYLDTSNTGNTWQSYWFEKNLQGDITYVYDNTGTPLAAYTYDAWGNHTATYWNGGQNTVVASNPFRYRGYYYDTDLGLYYLNSRYYDSTTGRFINADALMSGVSGSLDGYNLYAYCNNNPVMYTDNSGEWPVWLVATLIILTVAAVANVVANHVTNANNKKEIEKELQDSYTEEQAELAIVDYLSQQGYDITEKDVNFKNSTYGRHLEIVGSNDVKNRYDRQYVSMIFERTNGVTIFAGTASAEWYGHNVIDFFSPSVQTANVDLGKKGDHRWWVDVAATILQILGME